MLAKNQLNHKLNLYLGFPPAKRANPIRLVINLRVPYRLIQRPVQAGRSAASERKKYALVNMATVAACVTPAPMPRSSKRSSTLRNESGKRTYSITAQRMISGLMAPRPS